LFLLAPYRLDTWGFETGSTIEPPVKSLPLAASGDKPHMLATNFACGFMPAFNSMEDIPVTTIN
jgi:hypothetical protein